MNHLFSTSPVLPGANTRIRESRVSTQGSHHHLPLFLSGSSKDISVSVTDFIFVLACATPVCQPITVCAFGSCHTPCRCKGKSCVVFTLSQFLPRGNICLLRESGGGTMQFFSPLSLFPHWFAQKAAQVTGRSVSWARGIRKRSWKMWGKMLGRREYFCGMYIYLIVELLGQRLDSSYGFTLHFPDD